MIDYTKAAIEKTIKDLKLFAFVFNISVELLSIAYLVYASVLGAGYLSANIILAALGAAYLVFYIVTNKKEEVSKEAKEEIRCAYKWIKIVIRAFTLGVTVYGVYIATERPTLVSIVMAAAMAIGWTVSVLTTLLISYITSRAKFIFDAIEADIEKFKRPVEKVENLIKRVRGEEIEPKAPPTKNRKILEGLVLEYRAKREKSKIERLNKRKRKSEADSIIIDASEQKETAAK